MMVRYSQVKLDCLSYYRFIWIHVHKPQQELTWNETGQWGEDHIRWTLQSKALRMAQSKFSIKSCWMEPSQETGLKWQSHLPAWSSFSVLEMVEPVRAARVADGEALYRESLLRSISLMLLADSPSFCIRIVRSWSGLATNTPFSTWYLKKTRSWNNICFLGLGMWLRR